MIRLLPNTYAVSACVRELERNSQFWNLHSSRTGGQSPHRDASDIWLRFNAIENIGDNDFFSGPHESVWYECSDVLFRCKRLAENVMKDVEGVSLGGVLITKIPPGKMVHRHTDSGWHAENYEKFAVQLKGNKDQAFCFDDCRLSAEAGELYTFDNSRPHWVTNQSQEDRITMIVCVKR